MTSTTVAFALKRIISERESAQARAQAPKMLHQHGGDRRNEAVQERASNPKELQQYGSEDQPSDRRLKYGETADYLTARIARDHKEEQSSITTLLQGGRAA